MTAESGELHASSHCDPVARALSVTIFAIAALACIPGLQSLAYLWRGSQYFGHAYAIPLAALLLTWGRRREIEEALRDPRPPASGALLVFAAGSLEALAVIGDVNFLAGAGIPLLLASATYAVGGWTLLRPLAPAIGFLVLMVPPPGFLLQEILVHLKLLVTGWAVAVLRGAGVPIMAEGNQIIVPDHTLFVADACSGLTSIVSMLPLACIVAWFVGRGVWRRALVIASVVPLALGANLLRIVATVLLISQLGREAAQGILHEGFGIATYMVGTFALVALARVLR